MSKRKAATGAEWEEVSPRVFIRREASGDYALVEPCANYPGNWYAQHYLAKEDYLRVIGRYDTERGAKIAATNEIRRVRRGALFR